MSEPNWVSHQECLTLHSMIIAMFGGTNGMRDEKALKTSLNSPIRHYNNNDTPPSVMQLASNYCSRMVKSNPFLGGNKRTGFVTAVLFLESNGYQFTASEEEAAIQILALADSRLSDEELTTWFEASCSARS